MLTNRFIYINASTFFVIHTCFNGLFYIDYFVQNPTLQAIFPAQANLNILRTLQPGLTPLPNVTGFGSAGSVYAQLFYAGVEQFYCTANSCSQTVSGEASADWTCSNLQCTCRTNTSFCGGGVSLFLLDKKLSTHDSLGYQSKTNNRWSHWNAHHFLLRPL